MKNSNRNPRSKTRNPKPTTPTLQGEGYASRSPSTSPQKDNLNTTSFTTKTGLPITLTHSLEQYTKAQYSKKELHIQHFSKMLICHATTSSYSPEAIGEISARYINLPLLVSPTCKPSKTSNFYTRIQDLNSCNSDGYAYARALFCTKGKLLPHHCNLGPFGREIEGAAVLVVRLLRVQRGYRGLGVARELMRGLVRRGIERTRGRVGFVVVFPMEIEADFEGELVGKNEEEKEEIRKREYANAVGRYRALGFRRIGVSGWFGLALEEGHRSRGVEVKDDWIRKVMSYWFAFGERFWIKSLDSVR